MKISPQEQIKADIRTHLCIIKFSLEDKLGTKDLKMLEENVAGIVAQLDLL